jgi:hypothetical protein
MTIAVGMVSSDRDFSDIREITEAAAEERRKLFASGMINRGAVQAALQASQQAQQQPPAPSAPPAAPSAPAENAPATPPAEPAKPAVDPSHSAETVRFFLKGFGKDANANDPNKNSGT